MNDDFRLEKKEASQLTSEEKGKVLFLLAP
jgi:hypothetical protein